MNMFGFLFFQLSEGVAEKKIRIFLTILKQMTESLDLFQIISHIESLEEKRENDLLLQAQKYKYKREKTEEIINYNLNPLAKNLYGLNLSQIKERVC